MLGRDCLVVDGTTRASVAKNNVRPVVHTMAVIAEGNRWRVLDNQHIVPRYFIPPTRR